MPIKLVPNRSPCEGGGELAILFSQGVPEGPKALVYVSQNKTYISVDAVEENAMTLSALIPCNPVAEEVDVQVYCSGRLIARAPFTFFLGANHDAAQILQYLYQNMPQLFPDGMNLSSTGGMTGLGQANQGHNFMGQGGDYSMGNPAYMLLVGACKAGIEPLVRALLQFPGVGPLLGSTVPGCGGLNVAELARKNGHDRISKCIVTLINHSVVTARLPSGEDPMDRLERGGHTPKESAHCVLHALKAVRDGNDAATAIKNFVAQNQKVSKEVVTEPVTKLTEDVVSLVISDEQFASKTVEKKTKQNSANVESSKIDAVKEEVKEMNAENQRLKELLEDYEAMKHEYSAKSRECSSLLQDRERLQLKISDLEKELDEAENFQKLEDLGDHGKLYRVQSDMTMLHRTTSARSPKPMLKKQPHSIDTRNPPLMYTQRWISKESGISLSMEDEASVYSGRRRSSLLSEMSTGKEGDEVTLIYPIEEASTIAESLYYDTIHTVTENWPASGDTEKMFRTGDRLLSIDGQALRDKNFEEVYELLAKVSPNESKKTITKQSTSSRQQVLSSREYDSDFDASRLDSILTQPLPSSRAISLTVDSQGLPFTVVGGNAVGLFVTSATCPGVVPGDQIVEINGESSANMTYEEALIALLSSPELTLEVLHNFQGWESQKLQQRFELDSAVYKCQASYSPEKSKPFKDSIKEMELNAGTMVHVVNTSLYKESGHWLAWKLSPTGHKVVLKKIPSATRAKELFGDSNKLYERVLLPVPGQ